MISSIVAMNHQRVIGRDNDLVWRLPNDLRRLHLLTSGSPVIMGRKTWESLPSSLRPLDGDRTSIVVSRNPGFIAPGAHVFSTWKEAKAFAEQSPGGEKTWVFGGAQLFAEALPDTNRIYATMIDQDVEHPDDPEWIRFPDFSGFEIIPNENPADNGVKTEIDRKSGNEVRYEFVTFARPSANAS